MPLSAVVPALPPVRRFSSKQLGTDQVTVCFFGDGALGQGLIYEVMNMASLWKLPIIYVCENNLYMEYTHNSESIAGDIRQRGSAFGIPGHHVDGQDVRAVYDLMKGLVERTRKGDGPAYLVADTYRFHGHHVGDINRAYYRSKEEEKEWKTNRDPIKNFGAWLVAEQIADSSSLSQIEAELQREIDAAVQFAKDAPYPAIEEVDQDVYA